MSLLTEPHGGSLNSTVYDDARRLVIKSYQGPIPRGHDKLADEYTYLRSLPASVAGHFGRIVGFSDDRDGRRKTTLSLHRHPEPSVAKALLCGLLTPSRTRLIVARLLDVLLEDVYPLASELRGGRKVWETYHAPRLKAVDDLAALPDLAPLCNAENLTVNGIKCPSPRETVAWLATHAPEAFTQPIFLAQTHLDPHLDNVLAATEGRMDIVLIDPRGQLTGPPHYDWSKVLKSLRTGYHQIHYGRYELTMSASRTRCDVTLSVSDAYDEHLSASLGQLMAFAPDYAHAEGVSLESFTHMALIAELVHVLSFSYYHANRPEGMDARRVLAYLAVASLLAQRLTTEQTDLASLSVPLFTKGT